MEHQSVTMPVRSIKSLRSNSIRHQDANNYGGLNVKVNLKKFPVDFFNMDNIPSSRLTKRTIYSKQGHKTERKLSTNFTDEFTKSNQILPEAKITSFFNIRLDSSQTNDSNPSRNDGFPSETKLTASDYDKIMSQEEISSINLNEGNSHQDVNMCTFSKFPICKSNFLTPMRVKKNQLKKETLDIKHEGSFSARMARRRASTKLGSRQIGIHKLRKQSRQKIVVNKWQSQAKNLLGTKVIKKQLDEQFCLPKITRNNN